MFLHILRIFRIFANFEAAMMKLAASEACPEGFSSRKPKLSSHGQVGCWRSPPGFVGEPTDGGRHADGGAGWTPLQIQGGCASSRLDHSLKVQALSHIFSSAISWDREGMSIVHHRRNQPAQL